MLFLIGAVYSQGSITGRRSVGIRHDTEVIRAGHFTAMLPSRWMSSVMIVCAEHECACVRACASVVRWRAIEWQCTHIQNWYTLWWQKSWLPWTFEASLGYASRCSRIISSCDDVEILRDVSRINKEAVICNQSAFGLSSWPARDATCRPMRYRFVIALFLQELHTQFGMLKALVSSPILL